MHDATADIFAPALGTLCNTNKVIDKDVHMCNRTSVFRKWGRSSGCGKDSASSASSEKVGVVGGVWSSGCGNGSTDAETVSVVIRLKGGGSPMLGCWGNPQQS